MAKLYFIISTFFNLLTDNFTMFFSISGNSPLFFNFITNDFLMRDIGFQKMNVIFLISLAVPDNKNFYLISII